MRTIKYILVNETSSKNPVCDAQHRDVPNVGHCCYVSSPDIETLVKLRRKWPEAKILGESELDTTTSHAPIRVSETMNALRRRLSDLD